MSRKQLLQANKISDAQAMSGNFQTSPVMIETADNVGLWIDTSGVTANTGVFTVQVRAYKDDNNFSDWADLTTTYTLANADTVFFRKELGLPNCQIRVSFVGSGDGTVDIWISATGS